jgi:hypothetical protein
VTIEHPALFAGELVRALLDGRKTQTRRLVTRATSLVDGQGGSFPPWHELDFTEVTVDPGPSPAGNPGPYLKVARYAEGDRFVHRVYPRWQPTDHLWVRETHAFIWKGECEPESVRDCRVEYRADTPDQRYPGDWPDDRASRQDPSCPKWRPSLHMPRWASRLTLAVTAVRVEQLTAISEADARAEGVTPDAACLADRCAQPHRDRFLHLWDELYGKVAPWRSSPWVWVFELQRVER